MFFRSLEGITIKDQERSLRVVDNKRIWGVNFSVSFKTVKEWEDANSKDYIENEL